MSKLMSILRRAPKRTSAVFAILAAALIIPATLFAWGPSRPTYTMAKPADHVTFDSITDNPNIGDERNFVGIRETGTNAKWSDDMTVQNGKEYTVRMYVHNNAAANLKLVAQNVTATFNLPTTTGKSITVDGFIDSTNATPKEVYDSATFKSGTDFNLAYVKGSLIYENNVKTFTLPESIFTSAGAKLGYTSMNGQIPGCLQYAGYVSFTVKPQFAPTPNSAFTMSKLVSKHGSNEWTKNYSAKPGETVDYLIQYKNTGNVQQDGVTFRDTLPAGETYVIGSTIYANSIFPSGTKASDNLTNGTGINIGSYSAGANAWVEFSAKVADNDQLANCGDNTLVNTAKVTTGGGSISDTANVVVPKECKPPVKPVYTCDSLSAELIGDNQYKFNGKATAENGATVKNYKFDFGDNSNTTVTNPTGVTHTYAAKDATYTATLNVTFNVDGSEKTVTSNACKVKITTHKTPEVPVYTCDLLTAELVGDNQYKFNGSATAKNGATIKNYTFDFGDNTNTTVTNPNGVTHTYAAKDATYTADLNVTFNVDGKEKTATSNACKVKITTHKTPETPVYTCDALTAELVSDNTYKFNGSATAENGATVKNYKFDFGDNASQTVTNPVDVMHTYAVANNTYTANLYVTFNVDGKEKTVTSNACKVQITVSKPPVKECKPGIPEGDVRCTETPVTPVTPVTPPELPTTGAGADISAFLGLGSLVTSVGYYRASRRRG